MNPRSEAITYGLLVVLLAGAAGLFVWNVMQVTAGAQAPAQGIDLPDFGVRSETSFDAPGVDPKLVVFADVDRFGPIATPIPTPTPPPTATVPPTQPPCAVGWKLLILTRRVAKVQPREGAASYVKEGDMLGTVRINAIKYAEKLVEVECTDTGVVTQLALSK